MSHHPDLTVSLAVDALYKLIGVCQISHIVFNPKWIAQGTDVQLYDNAVHGTDAPKLKPGQMRWFTNPHHQRGVIIGTGFGNVLFVEYTGKNEMNCVIVNAPDILISLGLFQNTTVTSSELEFFIGDGVEQHAPNIGLRIEQFIDAGEGMRILRKMQAASVKW